MYCTGPLSSGPHMGFADYSFFPNRGYLLRVLVGVQKEYRSDPPARIRAACQRARPPLPRARPHRAGGRVLGRHRGVRDAREGVPSVLHDEAQLVGEGREGGRAARKVRVGDAREQLDEVAEDEVHVVVLGRVALLDVVGEEERVARVELAAVEGAQHHGRTGWKDDEVYIPKILEGVDKYRNTCVLLLAEEH